MFSVRWNHWVQYIPITTGAVVLLPCSTCRPGAWKNQGSKVTLDAIRRHARRRCSTKPANQDFPDLSERKLPIMVSHDEHSLVTQCQETRKLSHPFRMVVQYSAHLEDAAWNIRRQPLLRYRLSWRSREDSIKVERIPVVDEYCSVKRVAVVGSRPHKGTESHPARLVTLMFPPNSASKTSSVRCTSETMTYSARSRWLNFSQDTRPLRSLQLWNDDFIQTFVRQPFRVNTTTSPF